MVDFGIKQSLFFVLAVLLFVAWLVFVLRVWARLVILKKVATDDYLMFAAVIFFTGYSAAGFYGVVGSPDIGGSGNGKSSLVLAKEASIGLQSWWLCEVLYPPVSLLSRTSVAVLLLRIAVERIHRRVIIGVIIAFWLVTIPLFFVMVFQCNPINYFWRQPLPGTVRGTCLDNELVFVISVTHTTISACCDWALGVLPIVMLWKVQISRKTKASLFILLSLGMVAGITLLVRIIYLRPVQVAASFATVRYYSRQINIAKWSVLEPGLCIIAGCLGTLRPLFTRWDGTWTNIKNGSARHCPRSSRIGNDQSMLGIGHMGVQDTYSSSAYRRSKQFQSVRSTGMSYLHQDFYLGRSNDYGLESGYLKTMDDVERRHRMFMDDEIFHEKHILHGRVEENDHVSSSSSSGSGVGRKSASEGTDATQPLRRVRPTGVRRTSTDSDFSMRFPSFTAPVLSSHDATQQDSKQQQQQSRPGRWPQWHHPHSQNQTEPLCSSPSLSQTVFPLVPAPAPVHSSSATPFPPLEPAVSANKRRKAEVPGVLTKPMSAAAPPTTLSPCMPGRVLVQTMTEVEYDDAVGPSAPTTVSMPTILTGDGTTMNSIAGDDLPRSMTFQGSHTVQISGPATKS